ASLLLDDIAVGAYLVGQNRIVTRSFPR
ncbi:MAG: hypothetical protein QOG83_872, partial [Alphaproteobacteria bacterium]|nr:hypothetical protein [Alphaproteobacteria bacterium]